MKKLIISSIILILILIFGIYFWQSQNDNLDTTPTQEITGDSSEEEVAPTLDLSNCISFNFPNNLPSETTEQNNLGSSGERYIIYGPKKNTLGITCPNEYFVFEASPGICPEYDSYLVEGFSNVELYDLGYNFDSLKSLGIYSSQSAQKTFNYYKENLPLRYNGIGYGCSRELNSVTISERISSLIVKCCKVVN